MSGRRTKNARKERTDKGPGREFPNKKSAEDGRDIIDIHQRRPEEEVQ